MLRQNIAEAVKPPPKLSVSDWADANRVLSGEAASEPGPWKTSRAPYTRGPMDAYSDPEVKEVVLACASQLGKTEIMLNCLGWAIDIDPGPMLLVQPNGKLASAFSNDRLSPMLRDTKSLKAKVAPAKSRDSKNTIGRKGFRGGYVAMASAESAADLSGRPISKTFLDEESRYESTKEGDAAALAERRMANFPFNKMFRCSSRRDEGTCKISAAFERSDKRQYLVPCPKCGHEQLLKWSQVKWDKAQVVDKWGRRKHKPETARYVCEACGKPWSDGERIASLEDGFWKPRAPFKGVAGFELNALYSPWLMLGGIVKAYLAAKDEPAKLRVFVNTFLNETWQEDHETADDDALLRRAENWGELAPADVVLVTAAVDTQDDRLEVEIVGWGLGEESWSLEYLQLFGYPGIDDVWQSLDLVLTRIIETADGRALPIRAVGVDTAGHHTDQAYKFCKPRFRRGVLALVGRARGFGNPVWPDTFSRKNKRRVRLFAVNVDEAKQVVTDRLKIEKPGPGYCHFPASRGGAYFKQYAAEKIVTRYKRGFKFKQWEKVPGARNEALDLRAYNYSALKYLESQGVNLEREAARAAQPAPPRPMNLVDHAAPPSGGVFRGGPAAGAIVPDDPYLQ